VIDLGPEGGADGGRIVAEGPPEKIAECPESRTGAVLRQVLAGKPVAPPPGGKRKASRSHQPNIVIRGASEHNLKNINAEIPRGKLTVFSGVSGSGKTSLALDTIYAEGQRRFVESLSPYARQFVSQMPKPKVRRVFGLSPAIAVDQRGVPYNPRATVGTMTQIYDYMRVLFARLAEPYCPHCQLPIGAQTADTITERIIEEFADERVLILAPLKLGRQEDYPDAFQRLMRQGWTRVRIDGEIVRLSEAPSISRRREHQVELVVDRLTVSPAHRPRVAEAVEAAAELSGGDVVAIAADEPGRELRLSLMYGCPHCGRSYEPLTPRHFSFNHPTGWCRRCEGLGVQTGIDLEAIVTDDRRSIAEGAIALWGPVDEGSPLGRLLTAVAEANGFTIRTPIAELDDAQRQVLLHGTDRPVMIADGLLVTWRGVVSAIEEAGRLGPAFREKYARGLGDVPCPECRGGRLRPEAAAARLAGRTIVELCRMPLNEVYEFFATLSLTPLQRQTAGEVLDEIRSRLRFLVEVGLDYLTLDRPGPTLSGGEAQRVRLAGQLGSDLTGVTYVMDEPTIGIHPRDNEKMLRVIERLRDLGNTVIVVEHDPQTLRRADYLLDFGPGAGPQGGRIVARGTPEKVAQSKRSLTGQYMAGRFRVPVPERRRVELDGEPEGFADSAEAAHRPTHGAPGGSIVRTSTGRPADLLIIEGCREHNLKDITVRVPLNCLVCITGPSGSGKSTLVQDILYPELAYRLHGAATSPGKHRALLGAENLRAVALLDQSPIGQSPRSNPATYVGVFDCIRRFFAGLPEARVRGLTAQHFSFNRPGGRCDECEGMGARLVQMHFLPDVWVTCEACGGRRYKPEVLEVRYRGRNIADVLEMSIGEAAELFEVFPEVARPLRLLCDMGLDYLPLGQPAPALSGGEAQRLKIARELLKGRRRGTLYLLDEPTVGLHPADIVKLLRVLNRLVDEGNTVLVIEHNIDFVKNADWVIDLGPGGGTYGGYLMAEGTPERVGAVEASPTGPFLAEALKDSPRVPPAELTLPSAPGDAARTVSRRKLSRRTEEKPALVEAKQATAPWESAARQWHLEQRVHEGKDVYWEPEALEKLASLLDGLPAAGDWAHREDIFYASRSSAQWFARMQTDNPFYLQLSLRTEKGLFDEEELQERLGLRPWRELQDIPFWSDAPRVRVYTKQRDYDRVVVRIVSAAEITDELAAVIRDAWHSYLRLAETQSRAAGNRAAASTDAGAPPGTAKETVPASVEGGWS
ncbi:MAG: excinuclease ABC subunit A, partial [Armatimonadetes bacterium]|nr:excinuclease ABC subunit A [Armatimonadota bacterium]